MILVLTEAAAIQEVPVNEGTVLVLFQQHIGHGHHRGHIGARPDGDPLRIQDGGAVGVDRVEDNELDTGLLPLDGIVGGIAQSRPGRVPLSGCVTFCMLLSLSVLPFPLCKIGILS